MTRHNARTESQRHCRDKMKLFALSANIFFWLTLRHYGSANIEPLIYALCGVLLLIYAFYPCKRTRLARTAGWLVLLSLLSVLASAVLYPQVDDILKFLFLSWLLVALVLVVVSAVILLVNLLWPRLPCDVPEPVNGWRTAIVFVVLSGLTWGVLHFIDLSMR